MDIKARELEQIEAVPNDITLVYVEAIMMPTGEILCMGESIGIFRDFGKVYRVPQK